MTKSLRIILTPLLRSSPQRVEVPAQTGWTLHACGSKARESVSEQGFLSRTFNKGFNLVNREWDKSSRAAPESMRGRIYKSGQRVLSRLPKEEYFLRELNTLETQSPKLIYPKELSEKDVRAFLSDLAFSRRDIHQRLLNGCIAFVPFTLLFSFVPILPNLPLFWTIFRLYCHLTALRGARQLIDFVNTERLEFTSSDKMQKVLDSARPDTKLGFAFLERNGRVQLGSILEAPDLAKTLQRSVRQLERFYDLDTRTEAKSEEEIERKKLEE